jgi:hypothetical protein
MNLRERSLRFDTVNQERMTRDMVHYTCDLCKCELDSEAFVVRMEVYQAPCNADAAIDSDRDYLEDIDEVLERFDEFESDGLLPESDTAKRKRFELCRNCCEQFLQPLVRQDAPRFDFSKR